MNIIYNATFFLQFLDLSLSLPSLSKKMKRGKGWHQLQFSLYYQIITSIWEVDDDGWANQTSGWIFVMFCSCFLALSICLGIRFWPGVDKMILGEQGEVFKLDRKIREEVHTSKGSWTHSVRWRWWNRPRVRI